MNYEKIANAFLDGMNVLYDIPPYKFYLLHEQDGILCFCYGDPSAPMQVPSPYPVRCDGQGEAVCYARDIVFVDPACVQLIDFKTRYNPAFWSSWMDDPDSVLGQSAAAQVVSDIYHTEMNMKQMALTETFRKLVQ